MRHVGEVLLAECVRRRWLDFSYLLGLSVQWHRDNCGKRPAGDVEERQGEDRLQLGLPC